MAKRWVYFFGSGSAEADPQRKDMLGGKGASLAAMSRAGLPVPPGFTISTECCRLFLEGGGTWPDGLREEVQENLARLEAAAGRTFGDPAKPLLVSVRSGAAVSMPGMMDTILNCGLSPQMGQSQPDAQAFWRVYDQFIAAFARTVAHVDAAELQAIENEFDRTRRSPKTPCSADELRQLAERHMQLYADRAGRAFPAHPQDALAQCIEAVFRSWNNPRAVTYRRENDIRGCDGTAVNVQAMFGSQVSGIVFTTNPNNLAADEMIIESSYGLGEAVVSGEVHPDHFVVGRGDRSIKRRLIGHKAHAVWALGEAHQRDADAASLTDQQLQQLAGICLDVEKFFGRPMDIEWGWADGSFALLQARPIRGLEVTEDVEIGRMEEIHRLREMAGNDRKVWVLHNLTETLPAPTPLTWDIVRHFMSGDGGFGKMYRDFGYRPSDDIRRNGFLELICGRIYADPQRAADMFWDGFPLSYGLDEVAADPRLMDSAPTRFDPDKPNARLLRSLPRLLLDVLRCSRQMKRARRSAVERFEREVLPPYLDRVRRKRSQALSGLSTKQVLDELHDRMDWALTDFGAESLKPGFFGGMARAALEKILVQLMGTEAGTELALTLTQGLGGDSTVQQSQRLYNVARGQATLEEFLTDYGHRAVEEMELSRPRWREDASYVRQVLSAYLDAAVPSPQQWHDKNAAGRKEAEKALPETLRRWGGSCLLEDIQADLRDAQRMLPYRETGKHYLMMGYETIRLTILELGRRWNLGRDVFFLKLAELESYEGNHHKLTGRMAARKIRWQSARRLEMPEVIDSRHLDRLGVPREYEAARELAGQPIAAGVASGTARIVKDPRQTADLCSDYILVCHSTDPGWTALFVRARGLVVEQGGVLSHGAIVARDFGIPAVACPDATRRIPDTATIRVDGNRGLITLLEDP